MKTPRGKSDSKQTLMKIKGVKHDVVCHRTNMKKLDKYEQKIQKAIKAGDTKLIFKLRIARPTEE